MGAKLFAAIASCVVALVGCAGPSPTPTASDTAPDPTAAESTTVVPTVQPTTVKPTTGPATQTPVPAKPTPTRHLSADQARSALLGLDDLPSGWRTVPTDEQTTSRVEPATCQDVMRPQQGRPEVAISQADFQLGKDGPRLVHTVVTGEDELSGFVTRLRNALPACRHFSATSADGFTTKYETVLLTFPKLGDATLAFRTTGRIEGELSDLPFGVNAVLVAEGNAMVGLAAAGFDEQPDEVSLEPLVRKALDKLQAAR